MIDLEGSERQIAWATKIRAQWMPLIDAVVSRMIADPLVEDKAEMHAAYAALQAQSNAAFWIDNRYQDEIGFLLCAEVA